MAARGLGGGGRRLKAHPDQAAQQIRVIGVGGDLRLDSLDLVAEVSVAAVAAIAAVAAAEEPARCVAADAEQHQTAAKQEREHEIRGLDRPPLLLPLEIEDHSPLGPAPGPGGSPIRRSR